jgi:hypothetical protein
MLSYTPASPENFLVFGEVFIYADLFLFSIVVLARSIVLYV